MLALKRTLCFLLSLAYLQLVTSFYATQSSYQVFDLFSKVLAKAQQEANTWSASQPWSGTVWTNCGGDILVGGFGTLGTASSAYGQYYYKTYYNVPAHTYIYYSFTIWGIDSLSFQLSATDNDYWAVQFDSGTIQAGCAFNVYNYFYFPNQCGASWGEAPDNRAYGRVRHNGVTGGSVTMKIIDYADQHTQDESFGFRELSLVFVTPVSDPGEFLCTVSKIPISGSACSCPEGTYQSGASCVGCHASCVMCFGPLATQCYSCRPGYSWIGGGCTRCAAGCSVCHGTSDIECDQCLPGYFLYNSNSCVYPCDWPLIQAVDSTGVIKTCANPCPAAQFVYWDGSCNATCASPMAQDTTVKYMKVCYHPCPEGQYLYWDGSCSASCDEPLLISTYLGKKFCNYDCLDGKYLYWNGTCIDACLPPLVWSDFRGKQLCNNPCGITQYLWWDGTCSGSCDFPRTAKLIDSNLYCDYPCLPTEFLYWDGSCDTYCRTLLSQRTESTVKPRKFCEYLGATTDYLYWDGIYRPTCPFPLTIETFKGRNFCKYLCDSTQILFWNGTCLPIANCASPLSTRSALGARYCEWNCPSTALYLYWDGTCESYCNMPLTIEVLGGVSYPRGLCRFNCAPTEYLYWNSSCISTCGVGNYFTFTTIKTRRLCHFPCAQTEYLYYDGTCKENCVIPLTPRYEAENNYCDYPCLSSEYLYWNGTCISSCDGPLRRQNGAFGERYCLRPCNDILDYYNYETGLCQNDCEESSRLQTNDYLVCLPPNAIVPPSGFMDLMLTASAKPGDVSFLSVNKLSGYVRFMDIKAPGRLSQLIHSKGRTVVTWNVGIEMPDKLKSDFPQRILPFVFARNGMPSSFLINFWSSLIMLAVFVLLACACKVIELAVQNMGNESVEAVCTKFRQITMFNMCFVLLGYYTDDAVLYVYLDLSTLNFDKSEATVSLFMAGFVMILVVGFFGLGSFVICQFRSLRSRVHVNMSENPVHAFNRKWQSCSVFYRDSRREKILQQCFYMIYVLRMILAMLFTILCQKYPVLQAISQLLLTCVILGLIFVMDPFKRRINKIQMLCYEVGAFVINISSLLLASVKPTGSMTNSHFRTFNGDLIILGNVYLNVAALVFLIIKLGLEFWQIFKGKTFEKGAWVRLFVILFQQGAFGFEELLEIKPPMVNSSPIKISDPFDFSAKPRYPKNKGSRIFPENDSPTSSNIMSAESPVMAPTDSSPLTRAQKRHNTMNKLKNMKRASGGTIIFGDLQNHHVENEVMTLDEAERNFQSSSSPGNSFRLEPSAVSRANLNQEERTMDATQESGFSVVMGRNPNNATSMTNQQNPRRTLRRSPSPENTRSDGRAFRL